MVDVRRDRRSSSRSTPRGRRCRSRSAAVSERCAPRQRAPLRERLRRHARGSRRPVAAALGFQAGDSIAALFVSVSSSPPPSGSSGRNVDVLMDRSPRTTPRIARRARSRHSTRPSSSGAFALREAGGEHFADVVIGVAPGAAIGQGHAAADRVEDALQGAFPGSTSSSTSSRARARGVLRERIARRRAHRVVRARDPQPQGPRRRRQHRGLAPPEAAGRLPARPGTRHRRAGRSSDPRARSRR